MIRKRISLLFIAHSVIFIVLLFCAPSEPNTVFTISSLFFYLFQIFSLSKHVKKQNKNNYFEFNMMFFIMLTLCTYIVPLFYVFGLENDFYTTIIYKTAYINPALLLNSIAVEFYLLGYIKGQRNASPNSGIDERLFISKIKVLNKFFKYISLLSTLLLLAAINAAASESPDIAGPLVTIMVISIILPIFVAGYSNKYYNDSVFGFIYRNKIILLCAFIVFLRMILLGDRLTPLSIIFSIAFVYSRFIKPIGVKTLIWGVFAGAIFMSLISFTRYMFMYSNSASDMISSFEAGSQEAIATDQKTVLFQDVIPINLDLLIGMEYVNQKGYYKPMRFIVEALAPIPFVPSFLKQNFFGGYTSTAVELTHVNQKRSITAGNSGLGNHIVSDIYMSWGVLGVILVFFVWGRIIGNADARSNISFISCLIYGSMMSYAIYFPRSTIDTNFRDITYMILVFYIIKKAIK